MQNLLRGEPLKLVNGGQSQRTFLYIKDAIEAVLLMIVCLLLPTNSCFPNPFLYYEEDLVIFFSSQENPARANGQIFNVGNPNNEVTVKQLAEMMIEVTSCKRQFVCNRERFSCLCF